MKTKTVFLVVFLIFISSTVAFAHQPRIKSEPKTTEVKNPEVSQAFYGELKGEPDYYRIDSNKSFSLTLGVLVPDVKDIDKDVSAVVEGKDDNELYKLDANKAEWEPFYEEFAGDNYFQGPELKDEVQAGIYIIKVYSPDNKGKYVLVVGEKEEFPPGEIANTVKALPKLKSEFFEKPAYTAYFNLTGLFLLISFVLAILILLVLIFIIRRIIRKKRLVS